MPAAVGNYCRSHAEIYKSRPPVEEDLSSELAPFFSEEDGSLDVHRALERVFKALGAKRISQRRAATFGYLGQLILLSKPGFGDQAGMSKGELRKLADIVITLLKMRYDPNWRPQVTQDAEMVAACAESAAAAQQTKRRAS
ncbi:MAG: hypothetical protein C5B47_03745 [Verrucomicrobia bacterium]|nr:MAG: hypothetical protein C5B47_03745 [Verrucomicrobiota bacterium]